MSSSTDPIFPAHPTIIQTIDVGDEEGLRRLLLQGVDITCGDFTPLVVAVQCVVPKPAVLLRHICGATGKSPRGNSMLLFLLPFPALQSIALLNHAADSLSIRAGAVLPLSRRHIHRVQQQSEGCHSCPRLMVKQQRLTKH
jgi:hypothetical protein